MSAMVKSDSGVVPAEVLVFLCGFRALLHGYILLLDFIVKVLCKIKVVPDLALFTMGLA